MRRLIPPSIKQRSHIAFGFDIIDVLVMIICIAFGSLFLIANLNYDVKLIGVLGTLLLICVLMLKVDNLRGYQYFFYFIIFILRRKRMTDVALKENCEVTFKDNKIITPNEKSKIIEIHGIDFGILPERKQDSIIFQLANLYKNVQKGSIVKLDKPINFNDYINQIKEKIEYWEEEANAALSKYPSPDDMPDSEAFSYLSRIEVLQNLLDTLDYNQTVSKNYLQTFYLIMYDVNEDSLDYIASQCMDYLNRAGIDSHILNASEVKQFYELFFEKEMDENDNFVLPNITEKFNKLSIDGQLYRIATIDRTSLFAPNAWLNNVFRLKGTKVVMNFSIEPNKQKIFKTIHKSIIELRTRYNDKNTREDQKVDIATTISAIEELMDQLKMDNEMLHNVSYYIMYPDEERKEIRQLFKDINIYTDSLDFRQFDAYLAMLPYAHELEVVSSARKQWQSSTLSATFPFVTKTFMDPEGEYLGVSDNWVFFDQFYSWKHKGERRTSANLVVLGKTGGGKSYYMKKNIMQHLYNGVKVFILDPENEYDWLAKCFGGNIIDVGGVGSGIINPLQVFPTLKADDDSMEDDAAMGEVSSHRQFLQEFFSIICPRLEDRCFTYLDEAIGRLYTKFNINDSSDVEKMKPEEFPTLEDLYNEVDAMAEVELNNPNALHYNQESLVILRNNLKSFKRGGVHSRLWNGITTLELNNDLTVLTFQSLFSSSNKVVANAQMLLVMRYLMQEVIKNKNNNELYGTDKNILVAVDEAHQFIDAKFPVALDFMAQMIKRIRKYGGAMVVTTQNISDFVGQSEETKAKATAVINGCQYSLVFGLNPNDVNNMIDLYSKYNGGLTQNEIDILVDAQQGEALFLVDSNTRMSVKIHLVDGEEDYILRPKNDDMVG